MTQVHLLVKVIHTVNSELLASILFSRITLKDIFATLKNRDYGILPLLVNDREISSFRERFIFTKLRICEVS